MPLYVCGFVVLGAAFQNRLSTGAVIMGWGIAELAIMICTVAVCAYSFPILNVSRCQIHSFRAPQTHTATIASRDIRHVEPPDHNLCKRLISLCSSLGRD